MKNRNTTTVVRTPFEKEVYEGLTAFPKYLSSKFFYDKKGDALFQKIMGLPEYYLTRCETEIFELHKQKLAEDFDGKKQGFDLIELGAGDGKKTKILLQELLNTERDFTYKPIDISQNALDGLARSLEKEFPKIKVSPERGEYFEVLKSLKTASDRKKVIMVLGSNIGNLLHPRAIEFLQQLCDALHEQDVLFIGFDQKKNPQTVLDAYNDSQGVTAAFNKNILTRINQELAGDFNLEAFKHWEVYDPETGTAKSYLVSKHQQTVTIDRLGLKIDFAPWESVHTEISQKYDDAIVSWLAAESGLEIVRSFADSQAYYKNYLFKKK